jgi:DNA primase
MAIPPRFLDELRTRLTLSDIVGRKVRLSRAGREFKGCCPFHTEKTPSFYVNDDKQFYHCFGCGAHGSAIDFVMQHDNLSFIEAVEALAGEAGMEVPRQTPQEIEKEKLKKDLHSLLEEATRWMEAQLRSPENRAAYTYITERGMSEEVLSAYRIGYAPHDGQAVRKHMLALGYSDAQMIEAGVLRPAGKAGEPYAFFRERIIFPVPDRRGRVVAFGGRILPDHLLQPNRGDYKPAKYMNSSDTPLFHKGSMLYGEPHARMAASEGKPIVVVEGYVDVIAAARAGYTGAVAPLGTALTEEQILVLWKMIPQDEKIPILCFDGDDAGRRAAARACERLMPHLKPNHSARIAFLPEGQDPDSLVGSQGARALQAVIDAAISLVDFIWGYHTAGKAFDTPEARAGLTKTLEDEARRIPDRDVQYHYLQAFRERTRQSFGFGAKNTAQSRPGTRNGKFNWGPDVRLTPPSGLRRPAFSRDHLVPAAMLAALINHPFLFDEAEEVLGQMGLGDAGLDQVRQTVLSTLSHNPELDGEGLKTYLHEAGLGEDLGQILSESVYTHAPFARPSASQEVALEGWREAWEAHERVSAQRAEREEERRKHQG